MPFRCLCDICIDEMRLGCTPSKHYIPSKLSKLEKKLYKLLATGKLRYLGQGRHRVTFLSPSGKAVIKFPLSHDGIEANWSERFVYTGKSKPLVLRNNTKGINRNKLAGCRMLGPNLLIMTKVKIDTITEGWLDNKAPKWVQYIDCGQVGYHPRTGKLVAFDYTSF